jgi:hypothetical protein
LFRVDSRESFLSGYIAFLRPEEVRDAVDGWTSLLSGSAKARKSDSHLASSIGDRHAVVFDQASHDVLLSPPLADATAPASRFSHDTRLFFMSRRRNRSKRDFIQDPKTNGCLPPLAP